MVRGGARLEVGAGSECGAYVIDVAGLPSLLGLDHTDEGWEVVKGRVRQPRRKGCIRAMLRLWMQAVARTVAVRGGGTPPQSPAWFTLGSPGPMGLSVTPAPRHSPRPLLAPPPRTLIFHPAESHPAESGRNQPPRTPKGPGASAHAPGPFGELGIRSAPARPAR
ncbi:hypothetical protein AMK14_07350 [Streptomyces sp. TSRI0445]|nr:hypothetical protein AMK14_07350 [Streptomyces sp. TSRI0445]